MITQIEIMPIAKENIMPPWIIAVSKNSTIEMAVIVHPRFKANDFFMVILDLVYTNIKMVRGIFNLCCISLNDSYFCGGQVSYDQLPQNSPRPGMEQGYVVVAVRCE